MEENIINLIAEAEAQAVEIKAEAQLKATELTAQAESRAAQIAAEAEKDCKALFEEGVAAAEKKAQEDYLCAIEESRRSASEYADSLLERTGEFVADIVGRITK